MMYRIFAAAMAAGLLAAALISVVEVFTTTPMILQAESYEVVIAGHDHSAHVHDAQAWAPEDGFERFFYTVIANAVTGIAFALMVAVGLTVGERKADLTKGVLIALGGFAAFTLAPMLGLPPELPGMPVADLQDRQLWWAGTVALSIGGLWCLFMVPVPALKLLGVILLVAPHVWGAPHAMAHASPIPATLAARFAATSIVINALLWGAIGIFTALFYERFKGKPGS